MLPDVYAVTLNCSDNGKDNHRKVLFQLKEFHLYIDRFSEEYGVTFPFLRRCPKLQRLRLPRFDSDDLRKDITGQIVNLWPDLEHLDMINFEQTRRWGDEVDAGLLVACATPKSRHGRLKSLVLAPSVRVIAKTLQTVLALHTATLVDLNILGCSTITSANLQIILCSCPCLRSMVALGETPHHPPPVLWNIEKNRSDPCLDSRDVEFANSWVCLGLERLRLQIRNGDMSKDEDRSYRAGIPRAIYGLIRRLKHLRDLRLGLMKPTWEDFGLAWNGGEYIGIG
ncbi:hypothetical protein CPC16_005069 [Podila verticillata]|nr:hypothetical protein CPC16_005069 [Podila verticillata]